MDPIEWIARAPLPFLARCRIPSDLNAITRVGEEASPRSGRTTRADLDRLWGSVQALYRTGVYPALQVCVRRRGRIVLNRALGHASGNAPDDPPEPSLPAWLVAADSSDREAASVTRAPPETWGNATR